MKTKKIVINVCYGGFGLSDEVYEKLIELGIPVRKYINETIGSDGRYKSVPENKGQIIFDRELTPRGENDINDRLYYSYKDIKSVSTLVGRYWDTWLSDKRDHPLLVKVVEELGSERASGPHAKLKIVEIPDDVEYTIEEYDGTEWVAEKHRTWR